MPKIFISYSRVDTSFIKPFVDNLARLYGHDNIWYDDKIHGGQDWWQLILDKVKWCEVFIYLLSNESVASDYCQAEFDEAQRLQKHIITVQVRDRTQLGDDLSAIQYVDMKPGIDMGDAYTKLYTAISLYQPPRLPKRPLWRPQTPQPKSVADPDPVDRAEVDTPKLTATRGQGSRWAMPVNLLIIIIVIIGSFVLSYTLLRMQIEGQIVVPTVADVGEISANVIDQTPLPTPTPLPLIDRKMTQDAVVLTLAVQVADTETAEAPAATVAVTSNLEATAETLLTQASFQPRSRARPLQSGYSLASEQRTAGTIGAFLTNNAGERFILTASFIMGFPIPNTDIAVLQPGPTDGGTAPADRIGVPYLFEHNAFDTDSFDGETYLDSNIINPLTIGLVKIDDNVVLNTNVPRIGEIQGVASPELGMNIKKVGRTTGYTEGTITLLNATVNVSHLTNDGETVTARHTGLIMSTSMSQGGDSGALVLDAENNAVGIIIAGSSQATLILPMEYILETTGLTLCTVDVEC